jgi:septum formation protein
MRLILASTSPRRREILALLGLPFDIVAPPFEERGTPHVSIAAEVLDFAAGKAESVAHDHRSALVIGSDTMISLAGEKMGKPRDRDDAKRMLAALSGKTHEIFTAVALLDGSGGRGLRLVERVLVAMRRFTEAEVDNYLDCNESLDKAGAYSIQGRGAALIDSIRGDFLAAVGMPLKPIADYLASRGLAFGVNVDRLYAEKSFLNWQRFS